MEYFNNPQLKLAFEFVQYTGQNIFLTGKAGTGKTTFLHNLKKVSPKRMVVVAPTGVAAINAGGVTLHSFFQMPFSPYIPRDYVEGSQSQHIDNQRIVEGHWKLNREKINIIKSLDLLVIDEISMVRADLLDQVDAVLRRYKNRNKVFGGLQLLMIGDIQQLAPVIKDDEWSILRNYYESVFFFSSKALKKARFISIELKHIFRQQDENFIRVLNKIRENKMDEESYKILSERYIPDFSKNGKEGYITLTTHNAQAKTINESKLEELSGKKYKFKARIEGQFPEYAYPTDVDLVLKPEAQVMFVKNDKSPEKRYFNGKIGKITRIDEGVIYVLCPGDPSEIDVDIDEWQNMKYSVNDETKEINEDQIGAFYQYPLKLAWAITIHKSQGLTFERAIIDAQAAFSHGQVYVALSRCKTLEGLVLSTQLTPHGIISDPKVANFSRSVEENQPGNEALESSKYNFQRELLLELFDFEHLLRKIFSGKKAAGEWSGSKTELYIACLDRMAYTVKSEMVQWAEKFVVQIEQLLKQNPDIEQNSQLQERIKKASAFFAEKLETIEEIELIKLNIETDNKAIKKEVNKFVESLTQLILIKLSCLVQCKNGFTTAVYLNTRAKAAIEPEKIKIKPKKVKLELPEGAQNHELYQQLKKWRDKIVAETDKPAYMVLQIKSMEDMSTLLPMTKEQLLYISGLGEKKIEQYGDEILKIITEYASTHNLKSNLDNPEILSALVSIKKKKANTEKKEKKDTRLITLELFKEEKNCNQIAQERGMSDRTIEGHLAELVERGDISVNKLVTQEKISTIKKFFEDAENYQLSPAKEALGDDYSWAELKYVASHLKHEDTLKN